MITFATFEVDVTPETGEKIRQLSTVHSSDRGLQKEFIKVLFSSARRFHPECRTVILTDQHTQFPDYPSHIEIHRFSLDTQFLTMSRTQAQIEFLKAQITSPSHLVFLDTDILIQQSLLPLFTETFDIGLTYREHEMPINGGVILIHGDHYSRALPFMENMLSLIQNEFKEFKTWFGSQYALKKLVPLPNNKEEKIYITNEGTRFLLLPGKIYNYTDPKGPMDHQYPETAILHFKGNRRQFLLPYYHQWLE